MTWVKYDEGLYGFESTAFDEWLALFGFELGEKGDLMETWKSKLIDRELEQIRKRMEFFEGKIEEGAQIDSEFGTTGLEKLLETYKELTKLYMSYQDILDDALPSVPRSSGIRPLKGMFDDIFKEEDSIEDIAEVTETTEEETEAETEEEPCKDCGGCLGGVL